ASTEVTKLSAMLQAPVLGFRRGRGVLDSRDPLSITLPLAHEMWREVDVVIGVGTRLFIPQTMWGGDKDLSIIRIDADPEEPERFRPPAVALIGDSKPILKALITELSRNRQNRKPRKNEMNERQAKLRKRLEKLAPQLAFLEAIRAE